VVKADSHFSIPTSTFRAAQPRGLWLVALRAGLGLVTVSRAAGLSRNAASNVALGRNRGTRQTWTALERTLRRIGLAAGADELRRPLSEAEAAWCRLAARRMQNLRATVRYRGLAAVRHEDYWTTEERSMIGSDVLRHFGLARDPFLPPANRGDLFQSSRLRALEEVIQETARRRGMLAISGEVGSGKTVAVRRVLSQLAENQARYRVSYVMSLDRERVNARCILEAVLRDMAGGEVSIPSSPEALTRAVQRQVTHLVNQNVSPLLVIDEAQALSAKALRPLKRIVEVTGAETGLLPGLGVILVGQPELLERLRQPDVRELRARLHIEVLGGLGTDLADYIRWRFERAGARREIVTRDAVQKMSLHYQVTLANKRTLPAETCGPLTVEADLTRAMLLARERGQKEINAQVLNEVYANYSDGESENGEG